MSKDKFMEICPICGNEFQNGPHIYGHYIKSYEMTVCDTCWKSNGDGWAPQYEKKILKHLEDKGLALPERNEKGWLPRD